MPPTGSPNRGHDACPGGVRSVGYSVQRDDGGPPSPGVHDVGKSEESFPVFAPCNFRETVDLLENILKACALDALLLMSDTKGYSVDNAMVEKRFTPFEILKVISQTEAGSLFNHRHLINSGLAGHLKGHSATTRAWQVSTGPVSGFEIPVFLMREGRV